MPIKKSELYSSLWKSCDELRGGMDASQYKDYVLVLLFVKYVSDKYAGQPDALIEVPSGGSFSDMVSLKGNKEIGDRVNKIIGKLAEANDLTGVINQADFNDADKLGKGKEMVDRLTNLIAIFENPALDFSSNRAEGDDILGDAYEYLMRHFATESGKSKGQFYTPAEVSRVIAKVVGITRQTKLSQSIYDPTCGSGSLLLKAADEAPQGITIYGQEKDNTTAGLAKMNMILHDRPTAEIWNDNTLSTPYFKNSDQTLKTFDFVVANPPFSDKAWRNGLHPEEDEWGRFEDGIPPAKNGDYAYLLHILRSMKSTGKGAIILPHGVLFRGNVEGDIRRSLIRKGVIRGIIGLPPNLFFGTGIPACIILLDKEHAVSRKGIFMIDASRGFMKDGNKNRLRHQDIHKIVDVFVNMREENRFSRMVPFSEIEENDYNLNIPRYIDSTEPEDLQDIEAHLKGGIPVRDVDALASYWEVCPDLRNGIFTTDRPGYLRLMIAPDRVREMISIHPEFTAFHSRITCLFDQWVNETVPVMEEISGDIHPKELIQQISERLLAVFSDARLIDPYDLYQRLMDYWTDTMQDDVYLVMSGGWLVCDGDQQSSDLLPADLVISRFFASEQKAIEELEADRDALTRELEEINEEQGGEDGLLCEAKNEKRKLTKVSVKARLTVMKKDPDSAEERELLTRYLDLIEQEATAVKAVKDARKVLDTRVLTRYTTLKEAEIRKMVIREKWIAFLASAVQSELDRVSQALASRITILAERYADPLPVLMNEVDTLSAKVDEHLRTMGFSI